MASVAGRSFSALIREATREHNHISDSPKVKNDDSKNDTLGGISSSASLNKPSFGDVPNNALQYANSAPPDEESVAAQCFGALSDGDHSMQSREARHGQHMDLPPFNPLNMDGRSAAMLLLPRLARQATPESPNFSPSLNPMCIRCGSTTAAYWICDPQVVGGYCCDACASTVHQIRSAEDADEAFPSPMYPNDSEDDDDDDDDSTPRSRRRGGGGKKKKRGAPANIPASCIHPWGISQSHRPPPKRRRPPPPSRKIPGHVPHDDEVSDDEGRETWRKPDRECVTCGTRASPVWRKGPKGATVCNRCGIAWARKRGRHNRKGRRAHGASEAPEGLGAMAIGPGGFK